MWARDVYRERRHRVPLRNARTPQHPTLASVTLLRTRVQKATQLLLELRDGFQKFRQRRPPYSRRSH